MPDTVRGETNTDSGGLPTTTERKYQAGAILTLRVVNILYEFIQVVGDLVVEYKAVEEREPLGSIVKERLRRPRFR